jgi:radial spoke head protein 1
VKHGEGTYLYQNKDTYSGWWQFGKKKGKGTYTYANSGMKLIGIWDDNKIV